MVVLVLVLGRRLVVAFSMLVVGAAGPVLAQPPDRPPNIVLILADDLGYGDVGCFGQQVLSTPRIDELASQGMRWTQFYAGCTVCAPSRSVLLTGQHTGHTPVRGNSTAPIVIRPGQPTVASLLRSAGYATACIGKWGVGTPDDLTNPNDVGFDHFFGYVNMWHAHNFYPEFLIRNGRVIRLPNKVADQWREFQSPSHPQGGKGVAERRIAYAPDLFIEEALSFIRTHSHRPFFLYLAMNVPHANNEAGKRGMEVPDWGEFATRDWPDPEKGFAAMVRNIDRDCGRIIDLLRELEIDQHTLVFFTSDNGPHQEGGHIATFFDSNGPFTGYKRDLTEGGIRVPSIAWWPGTVPPGAEATGIWYFGDFLRTFAELAGIQIPPGTALDSESFADVLRGRQLDRSRTAPLYWEFLERGSAQAVRFGPWKAIRRPMFDGPVRLFNLVEDPSERTDLAGRFPEVVRRAAALMDAAHRDDPNWRIPRPPR